MLAQITVLTRLNSKIMKCPICENSLLIEDKIYALYKYCKSCKYEELEFSSNGYCCIEPKIIPVRDYKDEEDAHNDSDKYRVFKQCQHCGKRIGSAMKNKDFRKAELPKARTDLEEIIQEARTEISEISSRINKIKKQKENLDWWNDINEYYKTERWKNITKIVLERDKYICQSCLSSKAVEVHHTVGRYRKNEPLFTLVSLCQRCHNIITEIDRGNHENVEKIKYEFDKNQSLWKQHTKEGE